MTGLKILRLHDTPWHGLPPANQFAPLSGLAALEQLVLSCSRRLPEAACLSTLRTPTLLCIESPWHVGVFDPSWADHGALVAGVLGCRTASLTCLELSCLNRPLQPEALLAPALSRLEGLRLAGCLPPSAELPPAPWLDTLRWAVVGLRTVASSRHVLQCATRLERLAVTDSRPLDTAQPDILAVLAWAGGHPSLAQLEIDHCMDPDDYGSDSGCPAAEPDAELRAALGELNRRLEHGAAFGSRLQDELCIPPFEEGSDDE